MKFSKTILSTAILFTSSLAMANTYNTEVGLEYTDINNYVDATAIALYGVYHFTEVDTSNKPLAEAAFLQKRSYIAAAHAEYDVDGGGNSDAQTVAVGFYIPNTIFFVGAQYQKNEDWNDTTLTLGVTPVDGLLISTSHNEEADDYVANVQAKYVRPLSGDTAINLEAGFVDGEDGADNAISLAADYYFTSYFSVGATVEDEGESAYGLRTRYFFNDSFSINGDFVSSDDADHFSIGAALRF